jgi:hypothetical protein
MHKTSNALGIKIIFDAKKSPHYWRLFNQLLTV